MLFTSIPRKYKRDVKKLKSVDGADETDELLGMINAIDGSIQASEAETKANVDEIKKLKHNLAEAAAERKTYEIMMRMAKRKSPTIFDDLLPTFVPSSSVMNLAGSLSFGEKIVTGTREVLDEKDIKYNNEIQVISIFKTI